MTYVSENFVRANGPLGGPWSAVVRANLDLSGDPDIVGGGILINNNGFGPINAFGGDAFAFWNRSGDTFGNDQWAQCKFKTVAGYTSTISISACVNNGDGTATYTYTLTAGNPLIVPQQIIITGMADAGNNGRTFVTTALGAGTFTCANASAVTRSGQTGTGVSPSDSGGGVVVRGSSANGGSGYIFHAGTNSFSLDGRVAYYELWKCVNGVGTFISGVTEPITTLPSVGDVLAVSIVGTTLTAYVNGVQKLQNTVTGLTSGLPGLFTFSFSGSQEYIYPATPTGQVPGNNGTTFNAFAAGDTSFTSGGQQIVQVASDTFTGTNGTTLHAHDANWTPIGTAQAVIQTNTMNPTVSGTIKYVTTFASQQYCQFTLTTLVLVATQNEGPGICITGTASLTTGYVLSLGSDKWQLQKVVAGTPSNLRALATPGWTNGDIVTLFNDNGIVTVLKNSMYYFSIANSELSGGVVGSFCAVGSNTGFMDTFLAGNVLDIFNISGNAGVAGVTVAWSGGPTTNGSVTADSNGNYTLPGLLNGTYTITPSKTGYTFSPANSSQTLNSADITGVNFTAIATAPLAGSGAVSLGSSGISFNVYLGPRRIQE